ncbi:MAG TPA: YceI family protein [Caulobacteraceae bacterium]|nr:YceI family protein [Caulobacteraceae bacterium]
MASESTIRRGLAAAGLAAALVVAPCGWAQMQMPHPVKDYKAAPAGTYTIDQSHAAVMISVPHIGFSYSVFRFTGVQGTLKWDPANPGADALNVTVDPKSIATANTGGDFSGELSGEKFLNAAKFPAITFVSRAFHPIDASHGRVEGDLTLMGVTKPVVFDVQLVGAGKGFHGPDIGVHAETDLHPADFGLQPGMLFNAPTHLTIDTEFDGQPG